jgi:bifunctional non-homologous end joining protein LigD
LRNQRGSTAIVPWSTRAKPNAPVAVPLSWHELRRARRADSVTIKNAHRRFDGDPWAGYFELRQSLTREAATILDTDD